MKQDVASEKLRADLRRYIDEIASRDPESEPAVKYWRAAGRTTLLLLLAISGLQYYFFDVFLTIMTLPQLTLVAGLP